MTKLFRVLYVLFLICLAPICAITLLMLFSGDNKHVGVFLLMIIPLAVVVKVLIGRMKRGVQRGNV